MLATRERPRSGQNTPGADHPVMRHDDQPLDLLVAGIGEREHRPIGVALARAHVHAADDAVGSRRGGDQDAVALGAMALDRIGEVDRGASVRTLIASTARARRARQQTVRPAAPRAQARDEKQPTSSRAPPLSIVAPSFAGADAIPRASAMLANFTPISRPAQSARNCRDSRQWTAAGATENDRKFNGLASVSTILPICALLSMRAWAAAPPSAGKCCPSSA